MTRRLDFNIFSLGTIALAITVFISLFAGISSNSSPSSDPPYSLNLEKSPSGSYLNLLVAESEENTSLKIRTDHYSSAPTATNSPESPTISSTTTIQSSSNEKANNNQEVKPTEVTTNKTPSVTDAPEPTSEPVNDVDLASLIAEFSDRNKKISTLLDQLSDSLDHLYLEKIIYQPELDSLYSLLSELDQLFALESDFVSAHSSELPDFYHKRHESALSSFSSLRDRLNYLLENLKPLSEDMNTYSYATYCESLAHSASETPETPPETSATNNPTPTESTDNPANPETLDTPVPGEPTEPESANSESNPPTEPNSNIQDAQTVPNTPESDSIKPSDSETIESTSSPDLDSFGLPVCSDASYVAEKASEYYSLSLLGWGDTSSWRDSALNLGLTVDHSPSIHSIGVSRTGSSPHVIWVESLSSSTTATPTPSPSSDFSASSSLTFSSSFINLSEYDSVLSPLNFTYRTNVSASSYFFIHLDSYIPSSATDPADNSSEKPTTDDAPSDASINSDDIAPTPDSNTTIPTDN